MSTLPPKFKAVLRHDAEAKVIQVDSIDMVKPKKNEVVVQVMATPCNPSDEYFLSGMYGFDDVKPKPPVGTGLEGSGIIVDVGEGVAKEWKGRRVAMFGETFKFISFMGCWGQYTIKNINDIYEIPKELDFDTAAYVFVNPMTVLGLLKFYKDTTKKSAIIQLAACSAVGRSLAKMCLKKGIPLINIVRKEENVKYMKEVIKSPIVLNSEDKDFEMKLKETIKAMNPSLVLDPVVGKVSDLIFHNLPLYAEHVIYGGLEGTGIHNVTAGDCLGGCKVLRGYWLSEQWPRLSIVEKNQSVKEVLDDLVSKDSIFKQDIIGIYKLEDYKKALAEYKGVASKGKLIFHPQD